MERQKGGKHETERYGAGREQLHPCTRRSRTTRTIGRLGQCCSISGYFTPIAPIACLEHVTIIATQSAGAIWKTILRKRRENPFSKKDMALWIASVGSVALVFSFFIRSDHPCLYTNQPADPTCNGTYTNCTIITSYLRAT